MIVFDGMIVDVLSNKKLNLIVTELYIRGTKLSISFVFITKFYFSTLRYINTGFCYKNFEQKRTSTNCI